jgi:hypothetical protein
MEYCRLCGAFLLKVLADAWDILSVELKLVDYGVKFTCKLRELFASLC